MCLPSNYVERRFNRLLIPALNAIAFIVYYIVLMRMLIAFYGLRAYIVSESSKGPDMFIFSAQNLFLFVYLLLFFLTKHCLNLLNM